MEKARAFQKNIYFCFIDYTKAFDYVDHSKLWKILKEIKTRLPYLLLSESQSDPWVLAAGAQRETNY